MLDWADNHGSSLARGSCSIALLPEPPRSADGAPAGAKGLYVHFFSVAPSGLGWLRSLPRAALRLPGATISLPRRGSAQSSRDSNCPFGAAQKTASDRNSLAIDGLHAGGLVALTRRRSQRESIIQPAHLVLCDVDFDCSQVFFQVTNALCPWNGDNVFAPSHQPGQASCAGVHPFS